MNNIAKTLVEELSCPVNLELLTQGVTLVRCGHKVQEAVALQLFEGEPKCPVCRAPITHFIQDHTIRNVVGLLTGLSGEEIQTTIEKLKASLPKQSIKVEQPAPLALPYPGSRGKFIFHGGSWIDYNSGLELCRSINFQNIISDSLIKEFHLLGYKDKHVRLCINFQPNQNSLIDYLKNLNIFIQKYDRQYISRSDETTTALFKILAENNEIPSPHFDLIKKIIENKCRY